MGRVGLTMAALAFVTVALSMLIPGLGAICVGPITAIAIGAGAGWWASKTLGGGTAGRGAGAGAIAGLGALFGAAVGLTVLLAIAGNNPEVQQGILEGLEQAQQQNPDAQLPEGLNPAALLGAGGAIGGFCFGLFYLFLATIGGLIAGLIYGRNRGQTMATAGAYPTEAATYPAPGMQSNLGPRDASFTESEGRARVYPTDQDESESGARTYPSDDRRE
jgi:hypothetical protein